MKKLSPRALFVLVPAAVLLAGCPSDEKVHAVKGSLQENGAAPQMASGLPPGVKGIDVAFHVLKDGNPTGEYHAAVVSDDGSFTVPGPNNNGIPPGKYRISVMIAASGKGAPSGGGAPPGAQPAGSLPPYEGSLSGLPDRFKGAIGRDKSPLNVDVEGPANLLVEIGKSPKVTKQ